jgi:hypothetical protein
MPLPALKDFPHAHPAHLSLALQRAQQAAESFVKVDGAASGLDERQYFPPRDAEHLVGAGGVGGAGGAGGARLHEPTAMLQ